MVGKVVIGGNCKCRRQTFDFTILDPEQNLHIWEGGREIRWEKLRGRKTMSRGSIRV